MFSPHPVFAENAKTTVPAGEGFLGRKIANWVFSILSVIIAFVGIDEPTANLKPSPLPLLRLGNRWRADVGGVTDEEKTNTFQARYS